MKSRSASCSRSAKASRAATESRFVVVATLLVALALSSCGLVDESEAPPRWAYGRFVDVEYNALLLVIGSTIEGEGFDVVRTDPGDGTVETDWAYGTSQRQVRGPSRRKVLADVTPGDEGYDVRLRVREEVIRKLGLMATDVRRSDDWEPFPDNIDDAEFLMTKLQALLRPDDRGASDDFYERRERFGDDGR